MRKRYLILGANGFIGSNLCDYIASEGGDVTCFDHTEFTKKNPQAHYLVGDFFDDECLRSVSVQYDVIYHAISTVNPGNSNERYMSGYSRDMIQTIKLCSWIADRDVKLVFLSSGGTVYGNHRRQPINEEQLARPINHYGNVKLCIENALRIFHIQNRLSVRIARLSNPYGPGQDYTKGVGFIDAALKKAMTGEKLEIWGDGNVVRDYIFIEDACFYLKALAEYEGNEIIFNVSSAKGKTQNEILEIIRGLGLNIRVEYRESRPVDVERLVLDNGKIVGIYGEHIRSIEEGINDYYKTLSHKMGTS